MSFTPMLVHIDEESPADVVCGLDGITLQESIVLGCE